MAHLKKKMLLKCRNFANNTNYGFFKRQIIAQVDNVRVSSYCIWNGRVLYPVWPDLVIFYTLGNFKSIWQQLICSNLPHS